MNDCNGDFVRIIHEEHQETQSFVFELLRVPLCFFVDQYEL